VCAEDRNSWLGRNTVSGRLLRVGIAKRPSYRRILLKLSGKALLGSRQYGVDPNFLADFIAARSRRVHSTGIEIGIVVGGGNIFRGLAAAAKGWTEPPATTSHAGHGHECAGLQDAIERAGGTDSRHERHRYERDRGAVIRRRAVPSPRKGPRDHPGRLALENPYFTTDTAAPSGGGDKGPRSFSRRPRLTASTTRIAHQPEAKRYERLTYSQVLAQRLRVLDATAVSLCMENDTPIVVFDLNKPENITRVAAASPSAP